MASGVDFFATTTDEVALLDYLGEPGTVSMYPWPVADNNATPLSRKELGDSVMIVSHTLGPPRLIRADAPAMEGGTRAALFNRLNWERLQPGPTAGLVDSNTSPVLLWQRGGYRDDRVIHQSQIGSQADRATEVSEEYSRWANRVMSWVRRRGTRVWGLEGERVRPDLDVAIDHISSIYALPDALAALEGGWVGRR